MTPPAWGFVPAHARQNGHRHVKQRLHDRENCHGRRRKRTLFGLDHASTRVTVVPDCRRGPAGRGVPGARWTGGSPRAGVTTTMTWPKDVHGQPALAARHPFRRMVTSRRSSRPGLPRRPSGICVAAAVPALVAPGRSGYARSDHALDSFVHVLGLTAHPEPRSPNGSLYRDRYGTPAIDSDAAGDLALLLSDRRRDPCSMSDVSGTAAA